LTEANDTLKGERFLGKKCEEKLLAGAILEARPAQGKIRKKLYGKEKIYARGRKRKAGVEEGVLGGRENWEKNLEKNC